VCEKAREWNRQKVLILACSDKPCFTVGQTDIKGNTCWLGCHGEHNSACMAPNWKAGIYRGTITCEKAAFVMTIQNHTWTIPRPCSWLDRLHYSRSMLRQMWIITESRSAGLHSECLSACVGSFSWQTSHLTACRIRQWNQFCHDKCLGWKWQYSLWYSWSWLNRSGYAAAAVIAVDIDVIAVDIDVMAVDIDVMAVDIDVMLLLLLILLLLLMFLMLLLLILMLLLLFLLILLLLLLILMLLLLILLLLLMLLMLILML